MTFKRPYIVILAAFHAAWLLALPLTIWTLRAERVGDAGMVVSAWLTVYPFCLLVPALGIGAHYLIVRKVPR
jgi:ABC-type proline/glycine betaine transport system permease subunit